MQRRKLLLDQHWKGTPTESWPHSAFEEQLVEMRPANCRSLQCNDFTPTLAKLHDGGIERAAAEVQRKDESISNVLIHHGGSGFWIELDFVEPGNGAGILQPVQ